jgi:hypothetical protein
MRPMSILATFSPEAAYLTKSNISNPGTSAVATAADAAARTELAARLGVTSVTGGASKQGR